MKNRVAFFVIALTLGLSLASPARAQSRTYTTIDFPGAVETGAAGINNLGQIVGGYVLADGTRHGFLYSQGTFTTIDDPHATTLPLSSEALGINNSGQIVGAFDLNAPEGGHVFEGAHAFLYSGGVFTTLDYPASGVINTTAEKINNLGNIVGVYRVSGIGTANGLFDVGGAFTTVNFPGGCCTKDNGINDAGDFVGQYRAFDGAPHQGFMNLGGVFTTLDVPGAAETIAQDINKSRDIVGSYSGSHQHFGFLYSGGTFSAIAFPGASRTEAVGINDQGDIVGVYQDSNGVLHGFVATAVASQPTALNFTAASAAIADFDDPAQVQAQITVNGSAPVPDESVTFTLGSGAQAPSCSAKTDATGTAACLITPNEPAGQIILAATFAGDSSFGGSSASVAFTVTKEQTTLKLAASSPTVIANGRAASLSATLKEDGTTPISGRSVMITVGSGVGAQSCTGTTAANGIATCNIVLNQPLGPSTVAAKFPGDGFYLPASDLQPVLVFAFLGSGSFVIGDLNAVPGKNVEYWGAQWASLNSLSGGPAPNAFKGFAVTAPQSCGGIWTSDPGNSSNPPATVPSYMAVISSSSVTQSGPVITGDAPKIVIVSTNPGYGPAPGHAGTGTVVAVLCGQ